MVVCSLTGSTEEQLVTNSGKASPFRNKFSAYHATLSGIKKGSLGVPQKTENIAR